MKQKKNQWKNLLLMFGAAVGVVMGSVVFSGSVTVDAAENEIVINEQNFPDGAIRETLLRNATEAVQGKGDIKSGIYRHDALEDEWYVQPDSVKDMNIIIGTVHNCDSLNQFPALAYLEIAESDAKELSFGKNLKELWICSVKTKSLKLNARGLEKLKLDGESGKKVLSSLTLGSMEKLKVLDISNANITKINTTKYKKLYTLSITDCKRIKKLDISKNKNLKTLDVSNSAITAINLKNNKKLFNLNVSGTKLKNLDIKNNKNLSFISVNNTGIKKLNLKGYKKIVSVAINPSKIKTLTLSGTKEIDLTLYVSKGETIQLKNYLGTGYKATYHEWPDSKNMAKYNKKTGTIKVLEPGEAYLKVKKGKNRYTVSLVCE